MTMQGGEGEEKAEMFPLNSKIPRKFANPGDICPAVTIVPIRKRKMFIKMSIFPINVKPDIVNSGL